MSNSPERPPSAQDPYAPKRVRDQDQLKPRSITPPREVSDDIGEDEPPIALRRMQSPSLAPPSLIGRPPAPPAEGRKSFITAREVALLSLVSIVSALVVIAFYKLANDAPPTAQPKLAAAPRAIPAITVTPAAPGPATQDEGMSPALPATAIVTAPPTPPAPAPAPATPPTSITAAISMPPPAPPGPVIRGVTDSEIRFGIVAPFSGSAKELGRQMKLGIDAAFGAVNAGGGVHGRQLKLIGVDDGYEPSRTLDAMKLLTDKDSVFGVVGNVGTPTATIALPFALQQKMLFFGAFTGAGLLRRDPPDRYVFNYRASYAEETDAAVQYLVKIRRLKPEQIAVFAQQDGYGDSGFAGVVKAVRNLRGDPNKIVRLNYKRNTVDVDEAVAQLRAQKTPIKAIVMVPTYRAAAKFIEKTHDLFPGMIYTNVSFVGSSALADELMLLGPRFAEGVIVTQVVPALEGYSSFVLEYKNALAKQFPGEAPDYVSLEGYVTGSLLAEGLRRAGPQMDTEKLVDALESLRDFDPGIGTPLTFGRTEHQASHKIWGTQLNAAGRYQPFELQ